MPRFVLLYHEMPASADKSNHFDLMFEDGLALRSWSLADWPPEASQVVAERLPDHRLAYLEYEGVISKGRGHVQRVDAGEYTRSDPSLKDLLWSADIQGAKYRGMVEIWQTSGSCHLRFQSRTPTD